MTEMLIKIKDIATVQHGFLETTKSFISPANFLFISFDNLPFCLTYSKIQQWFFKMFAVQFINKKQNEYRENKTNLESLDQNLMLVLL